MVRLNAKTNSSVVSGLVIFTRARVVATFVLGGVTKTRRSPISKIASTNHFPDPFPKMSSIIVKKGTVSVKEEGLRSFLWSKKCLVLREQTLSFHKSDTSDQASALLFLKELEKVERVDLKPCCLELATRERSYYLSFKDDEELYSWMDEIYLVLL